MGQYWKAVNLDKHEFLDAHRLGVGLKLGEQVGSGHGHARRHLYPHYGDARKHFSDRERVLFIAKCME